MTNKQPSVSPAVATNITKSFDFNVLTRHKRMLWILLIGMLTAFGPVCTDIYLPALPDLGASFNSSPTLIQLSLTACFLGLALGQIIIGPISDALGRRLPLSVTLIVFSVASLCCAFAPSIEILIALRFFQGFAGAGGIVLSRSMACDMFSGHDLTKFMALLMTVNSLAPIVGPVLGSAVVSFFSWHWLFLLLALWGIVLLAGVFFCLQETLPGDMRQSRLAQAVKDMFLQLLERRFLILALAISMVMGGFFAYLAASPFVLQVIYGFSAFEYALIFALNSICITLASMAAGRLERRMGASALVKLSFIVMMASGAVMLVLALKQPQSPVLPILCMLFYVAMVGSSQTPGFGIVMSARSKGAGAASGIFGILGFVIGSATSPLVGVLGDHSMLPLALCMFICALISYILFVIGMRLKKV